MVAANSPMASPSGSSQKRSWETVIEPPSTRAVKSRAMAIGTPEPQAPLRETYEDASGLTGLEAGEEPPLGPDETEPPKVEPAGGDGALTGRRAWGDSSPEAQDWG